MLHFTGNADSVLLFHTDGASNMKKAGRVLTQYFPNILHITCLAHGVHRVAEIAINQYPLAKGLLSSIKGVLARSPARKSQLKKICNRLLPTYIETRWTSFFEALPVYIEHFDNIKKFLKELKKEEKSSSDITKADNFVYNDQTLRQLHELQTRYGCFVEVMKELQTEGLPLERALEIAIDFSAQLSAFDDEIGKTVSQKWEAVATKNAGLEVLHQLQSGSTPPKEVLKKLGMKTVQSENIPYYLRATTVTADVERLFSKYSLHFSPRRQSAKVSTLNDLLTVQTNTHGIYSIFTQICIVLI